MRMCLNCAFWFKAIDVNYEVFIYMISASYFLGKVAYQVNGFVQDFLNVFPLTVHQ